MRTGERPLVPVAAGCLINERGEVLIAQRPVGKIAAGKWEFPGGKIEAGESPRQALERELREELGVRVIHARPLIRVRHEYADRVVMLDTWRVTGFSGAVHPHDAQALAWSRAEDLHRFDLLAADQPIVTALRLPVDYVFTPPRATREQILERLAQLPIGALLRLRLPELDLAQYDVLARELVPKAREAGVHVVLDRFYAQAVECGAAGWHASARNLQTIQCERGGSPWKLASCHSAEELQRARELGFDAAVLGPVRRTATHPERAPLDWDAFESLAQASGLPVYAIGGLGPDDLREAFCHYAQGVAAISAYWR